MSTKSLHIDKRITSLELTGGKPCIFQQPGATPDLYVYGGAHFKKESCFDGDTLFTKDLAVQGNLTALGDSRLPTIFSESITPLHDCLEIYGNLCVEGSANVDSLNVQKDTVINGDLTVIGNISGLPDFTDLVVETLQVTKTSQFDGDVTMFGNLIAAGQCLDIIGNVCITGELQVNGTAAFVNSWSAGATGLLPNTPNMGDIVLGGTLNVAHGGTGNNAFPVGALLIGDGTNPIQTTMPITYGVGSYPNPVNTITGVPTPYNASDVVPKSYVDAAVAGLNIHDSAYVASTGPLTATYSNGALGVGATLTNAGVQTYLTLDTLATTMIDISSNGAILPGTVTINVGSTAGFPSSGDLLISASPTTLVSYTGITATSFTGCTGGSGTLMTGQSVTVALLVGSRVMIKNQSNQTQNGIYDVTVLGDASTNWVLTRSSDFDNSTPGEVTPGDFIFVSFGQLFGSTGWVQTNSGTGLFNRIILGTDNVVFTQFSGAGTYSAGTGLTLTGSTFSITNQIMAGTTAANQVPQITYNNQGQITSVGTTPLAIPVVMDSMAMAEKYPIDLSKGVWYGLNTKANAFDSTCITIGQNANTNKGGDIAIGNGATAANMNNGNNNISIGTGAISDDSSIAIGRGANCQTLNGLAIGDGCTVANIFNVGIGKGTTVTGAQANMFGSRSTITGGAGTGCGDSVTVSGLAGTSIGAFSSATNQYSSAFGSYAHATGDYAVALGSSATANVTNSIVLNATGGVLSPLGAANALALGVNTSSVTPGSLGITLNGGQRQMELYTGIYATTVTSTTPLQLAATSSQYQYLTGTIAQSVLLPSATSVNLGFNMTISNKSTANATVYSHASTYGTTTAVYTFPLTTITITPVNGSFPGGGGTFYILTTTGLQAIVYTSYAAGVFTFASAGTGTAAIGSVVSTLMSVVLTVVPLSEYYLTCNDTSAGNTDGNNNGWYLSPLVSGLVLDNLAAPTYPTSPQTQGVWYGTGTKANTVAGAVNIGINSRAVGSGAIAIGLNANPSNSSGASHIAIGQNATCTNGNNGTEYAISIGVGASCVMNNTTFQTPIAIGRNAVCNYGDLAIGGGAQATQGVAIGASAISNSPGGLSIAIGGSAQAQGGFGGYFGATAVGYSAAALNNRACAFGYDARAESAWYGNTAIGAHSRASNNSGIVADNQTSVGVSASCTNVTGGIAIGGSAVVNATVNGIVGSISIGASANVTNSTLGIALGSSAAVTSANGIAIGASAKTNLSGTSVGYSAGSTITGGSNVTCIGNNAQPSGVAVSNEITLGDSAVTAVRSYGAWTFLSDARDKKDVTPIRAGLDFVSKLKPVDFVWNMRDGGKIGQQDCGFIAQDLQQAQEETGLKIPGLVYDVNPDHLEISPDKLLPVLVKALQEANDEIKILKNRLDALQPKI